MTLIFPLLLGQALDEGSLDHMALFQGDHELSIWGACSTLHFANGCSEAAIDELASSAVSIVNLDLADLRA